MFGTVVVSVLVLCTLLGPEGPGRLSSDDRTDLLDFVRRHGFGRVGEEYRPYFENYTVDASILKMQTKRMPALGRRMDCLCH